MQTHVTLPVDADTWFAPYIARPWLPSPIVVLPLAAMRFIKTFGLHHQLTPFVMNTIGAGSPEVARVVIAFIDKTNVRAVFVLAALGALLATMGILSNAELCLNHIWGDVPGRSWRQKFRSFFTVAIAAPSLLLLAMTTTAMLQPGHWLYTIFDSWRMGDLVLVVLRTLPYALLWLGFTLLYTGLPNTDVRTRSAIFGAVVAGTLWQLAQWTYVTFVIDLVRYSSVYGALWQMPILLAWTYIAWSIILYGAEVSRAHQEVYAERLTRRLAALQTLDTVRAE